MYEGPWVAERFSAVEALWKKNPDAIHPVVRQIVEGAAKFSATDTFRAEYRRAKLTRLIDEVMYSVDALIVPTAPTVFTIAELTADPFTLNARLGIHTNFANFADLCALALPAGMRADGLPAGITLLAPAWHDRALAHFGCKWAANQADAKLGATGRAASSPPASLAAKASLSKHAVPLAVVGAHLRGMPLNHQLTSRGAVFLEATTTSPDYQLYALPNSVPPKPGLARVTPGESGHSIQVELWEIPVGRFGSFVAEVPAPLGIGSVTLADGRVVKGFICEPCGIAGARDISEFGGWRSYLASLSSPINPSGSHANVPVKL